MLSIFCQDGAWDFFKIDEKIGAEGVVANSREVEGVTHKFLFMPPLTFTTLATLLLATVNSCFI